MKIFISRHLKPDSDFVSTLKSRGYEVLGEPLVSFSPIRINHIPNTDWLFFFNKSGVRFFMQQVTPQQLSGKLIATVGVGTAEYMEKIYRKPDFIEDGDPISIASAFLAAARGKQVLFLRAKDNKQPIQQLLGDKIVQEELEIYENKTRSDFELPICSVLVFTSPLNAEAYYSKYPPLREQRVIAIGETTKTRLEELGLKNVELPDVASEDALAKAVLRLH